MRALLARDILRPRRALGLSQAELARAPASGPRRLTAWSEASTARAFPRWTRSTARYGPRKRSVPKRRKPPLQPGVRLGRGGDPRRDARPPFIGFRVESGTTACRAQPRRGAAYQPRASAAAMPRSVALGYGDVQTEALKGRSNHDWRTTLVTPLQGFAPGRLRPQGDARRPSRLACPGLVCRALSGLSQGIHLLRFPRESQSSFRPVLLAAHLGFGSVSDDGTPVHGPETLAGRKWNLAAQFTKTARWPLPSPPRRGSSRPARRPAGAGPSGGV